jgi:hypothetical protein
VPSTSKMNPENIARSVSAANMRLKSLNGEPVPNAVVESRARSWERKLAQAPGAKKNNPDDVSRGRGAAP